MAEIGLESELCPMGVERAEVALKAFGEDVDQGRQAISDYWGPSDYKKMANAVRGWSYYHTNHNIHIVKEAMKKSRNSGNTVGDSGS